MQSSCLVVKKVYVTSSELESSENELLEKCWYTLKQKTVKVYLEHIYLRV